MRRVSINMIIFGTLLMLIACGGGGGAGSSSTPPPSVKSLTLAFQRVSSTPYDQIKVIVTVLEDNQLKAGVASQLSLTIPKGQTGTITETSTGIYEFIITPDNTGEYPVTVAYQGASATQTPLVLATVDSLWEQPMAVSGLVNTAGYEDGVTITPDGEFLFVQYGPIYFSGIFLFSTPRANGGCENNRLEFPIGTPNRCTHAWIDDIIGPVDLPERPGFFNSGFSNGKLLHNAVSWGVNTEEAPNFAPMTMFYGFKRQADGSFREPFYVAFDDLGDALINPAGLSFLQNTDGTNTTLFFLDDADPSGQVDINGDGSLIVDSVHDIYTIDLTLGQNTILGSYVATGTAGTPPVRTASYPSQLVGFDKVGIKGIDGTQGNPHLYAENGVITGIWTDDERDSADFGQLDRDGDYGDLSVYLLQSGQFPNGSWQKIRLPIPVNQPQPSNEIQPFFTGQGLYFTRASDSSLPQINYATYSGSFNQTDLINSSLWSNPNVVLAGNSGSQVGQIITIGEPTIAHYQGKEYLYFVYGVIRAIDSTSGIPDINMQAGFITKR